MVSTTTRQKSTNTPYDSNDNLPIGVKENLPKHAQDIYRAAFNNAWEYYADPDKRRGKSSREEVAHKVAWSAVENEYTKKGDRWVKR